MTKILAELPKSKSKSKKRLGRGYGSGKGGHTVGRGSKGRKARGKVKLLFEGTKMKKSLIRRLPFRRGKGKLKSLKPKFLVINVGVLNLLPGGTKVTPDSLVKHGLIHESDLKTGVKILGGGNLKVALTVQMPCSKSAIEKIEKSGGKWVK